MKNRVILKDPTEALKPDLPLPEMRFLVDETATVLRICGNRLKLQLDKDDSIWYWPISCVEHLPDLCKPEWSAVNGISWEHP